MSKELSLKIREQVANEQEKLAEREAMRAHAERMNSLVDRPSHGKSRIKAHKGEMTIRKDRARALAKVGKASRQRNRR
jgi:hypothetical protein